jgi:hypothetical protein
MVVWLEGEAELLRVDVNHLAAGCLMEVYLQETTNIAMEIPIFSSQLSFPSSWSYYYVLD